MKKEYLEILIEFLKNNNKFLFKEIVNYLKSKTNEELFEDSDNLSELHSELTLDNRFFLYPDKKWGLREDMTEELLKKTNNSYTYTSAEYFDDISNKIGTTKNITIDSDTEFHSYNNKKLRKNKTDITDRINDNLDKLNNLNKSKKKNVSQEIGVTEEIDWNSVVNDWAEK